MKKLFSLFLVLSVLATFLTPSHAEGGLLFKISDAQVRMSEYSNSENIMTLSRNNLSLSCGYRGCSKKSLEKINDSEFIYKDIYENIDLRYSISNDDLMEELILKTPESAREFEIEYTTEGLSLVQADSKTLKFENQDGQTIYKVTTPVMTDASGAQSRDLTIEVVERRDNKCVARITYDESWVLDEARVYPVVIDPNYTDEYFDVRLNENGQYITNVRSKDTSSSIYLNLISASFEGQIRVRVIGVNGTNDAGNKSFRQGKYVDHFVVSAGKKYVLYNKVNEDGCSHVKLIFEGFPGLPLKGCWSSDYDGSENCEIALVGDVQPTPKPVEVRPEVPEKLIKVPYISQERIRSGCESVSATMLLNFYGYEIVPEDFISWHLPVKAVNNGRGPDPNIEFAGDPYGVGYGCFSQCIANSLNTKLESPLKAFVRGMELEDLVKQYVSKDVPVLIWITIGLEAPTKGDSWIIDGSNKKFTWPIGEHCVVLVGYNKDSYFVNDPFASKGTVPYPKESLEFSFRCMGRHAVVVENLLETDL